jgi:hypothetical protein
MGATMLREAGTSKARLDALETWKVRQWGDSVRI